MKVILLGAPASGKGTLTKLIVDNYGAAHISTGNILRENMKNGTELGNKVKEYMDAGKLVPDELIIGIAKDRLSQEDCKDNFVLDGFPRTLNQAKELKDMLKELNITLDGVINLNVPEEVLYDRITGRRACPTCGATYHMKSMKPKVEGICDECGSNLIIRSDDNAEVFKERLEEYKNLTAPLIDFYNNEGILCDIKYYEDIQDTFNEMKRVLGE